MILTVVWPVRRGDARHARPQGCKLGVALDRPLSLTDIWGHC